MTKEVAVIGLGQFGGSVVKQLYKLGAEITVIDISESKIYEYEDYISESIVGSATDERMLKTIGIEHYDEVIVAIGEDIQVSILSVLILNELGVKNITAKAQNRHHAKVLKKVGASRILEPETEMGIHLANKLTNLSIVDYMEISDDTAIVEYNADKKIVNSTLLSLRLRENYRLNVIAVRRNDEVIVPPDPDMNIACNDTLIVIGKINDLNKFERKILKK